MKILLTGATGFLGSHVVDRLLERQHDVAVLLRPHSDTWRIRAQLPQLTEIRGELARIAEVRQPIADFTPEVLVHLAWGGVENRFRNDTQLQLQNVNETAALVHLATQVGVQHVVGLGSQAEYGPKSATLTVDEPTQPTTLYGATKLAACHLSRVQCELAGVAWSWIRLFSCYGPRDNPSWLIPYLALTLHKGERPQLTAAEQQWDYVYVRDAADAIVRVAELRTATGLFNLGSGEAPTLRHIMETVRDQIDPQLPLGFGEVPYRPDQVMYLRADISRLEKLAGWQAQTPLLEGILQTVAWYRAHPDGRDD